MKAMLDEQARRDGCTPFVGVTHKAMAYVLLTSA